MVRRPPRPMPPADSVVTFDTVPQVNSAADLFALAIAMEHEAAERYRALAAEMDAEGESELAALFRRLEEAEGEHANGIGAWSDRVGIAPSLSLSFRWDSPEAPSATDVAEAGGAGMSPWQALAMAVRNEERAFAFYTQIAAKTSDGAVRTYAEAMAREELEHVVWLRQERRRAWRGEYDATLAALPAAGPPQAADAAAFADYVIAVELETAGRLRTKAEHAREARAPGVADLFQDLAEEAEARARTAGATGTVPDVHAAPGPARDLLREEEQRAARLYDGYMRLIETADNADLLRAAQDETAVILARLARLRDERARTKAAEPG